MRSRWPIVNAVLLLASSSLVPFHVYAQETSTAKDTAEQAVHHVGDGVTAPTVLEGPDLKGPQIGIPIPDFSRSAYSNFSPTSERPILIESGSSYPKYPSTSSTNIAGLVVLEALVATNGKPKDVRVVTALAPELDEAAKTLVEKSWRFVPERRDGKNVASRVRILIHFDPNNPKRKGAEALLLPQLTAPSFIHAQEVASKSNVPSQLKGKLVTMRQFHREVDQTYDENGAPTFKGSECPWTICARMKVKDIRLSANYIEIRGTRVYVGFKPSQMGYDSKKNTTVRIALAHTADTQADVARALDRVFLHDNEDLSAYVPAVWQRCLTDKHCSTGEPVPPKAQLEEASEPKVYRVGGGVSAPKPLATPDLAFTPEARQVTLQGTVLLTGVIGVDGRLDDIQIIRPLGIGLDEAAIQKLRSEWRFKPGEKNGVPVPIRVAIEVNFALY